MKNFVAIALGLTGIGMSAYLIMQNRKKEAIEKNCGCKKTVTNGNVSSARVADVGVNSMNAVGGGIGGGRSASDMESIRPRGVAVSTFGGSDDSNSVIHENVKSAATFNRMDLWNQRIGRNKFGKSDPITQEGQVKVNRNNSGSYYTG